MLCICLCPHQIQTKFGCIIFSLLIVFNIYIVKLFAGYALGQDSGAITFHLSNFCNLCACFAWFHVAQLLDQKTVSGDRNGTNDYGKD